MLHIVHRHKEKMNTLTEHGKKVKFDIVNDGELNWEEYVLEYQKLHN